MKARKSARTYYKDTTQMQSGVTVLENAIEELKREKKAFIERYPSASVYAWDEAIREHLAALASLKIDLIEGSL